MTCVPYLDDESGNQKPWQAIKGGNLMSQQSSAGSDHPAQLCEHPAA